MSDMRSKDERAMKPMDSDPIDCCGVTNQKASDICVYLLKTKDGNFAMVLAVCYSLVAVGLLITNFLEFTNFGWQLVLGFFFMPILFVVVLIRHRVGTRITDNTPVFPCIISNLIFAALPIYFIWR